MNQNVPLDKRPFHHRHVALFGNALDHASPTPFSEPLHLVFLTSGMFFY